MKDKLNSNGLYLSEIDLENDLSKVLSESDREGMDSSEFVDWLQSSKQYNMLEYIDTDLTQEIADKIVKSDHFKVLAEFLDYE